MSDAAAHVAAPRHDAGFLRARLGSILALLPLGVWTVGHLWNNLAAFRGASAWQASVTEYDHPLAFFGAGLVSLLPLVIHAVWGIGRLFTVQPNVVRYPYYANIKYILQRLSAIGVLLFLGAHIWKAFLGPRLVEGHAETFADIAHEMHHHGPTLAVYILGVLGVAYHLANGVQTFAMGWGVVSTQRALRRLEPLVLVFFAALLAMGWGSIYALWDAGR